MQHRNAALKYRPDLDGLRAIAVLVVVAFHAFPNWLQGGFIGVDVFFVISGFLISSLLFSSLEQNRFSFLDFYQRRIKRIFPALLLVLGFCGILGWFALFPEEYKQLGRHMAGGAGFISNWVLWKEAGYFDNAADTKPLLHLWSLGIEEQFYILWPLILWAAWKKKLKTLGLTLLLIALSFGLNLMLIAQHPEAVFYSPQTRFWELLTGSLLAWLLLYNPPLKNSLNADTAVQFKQHLCSIFGFLCIAFAALSFSKQSIFPGALALIPVLGAVLIIGAGPKAWFNQKVLGHPLLIWFGLISFPLYLWHWPLLAFARIMEGDTPSRPIRISLVFLAILLAWLTYKLVEQPIRWGKKANALKITLLILLMTGIGAGGLYIKKQQGLISRFKNYEDLIALQVTPANSKTDFIPCTEVLPEFQGIKFEGGCLLSKKGLPDTLVLGDSHTVHYTQALGELLAPHNLLIIAQPSCLPFSYDGFLQGECKKKQTAILNFLAQNNSIKRVYVSGYWAYLMTGSFSKNGTNWRTARTVQKQDVQSFLANAKQFIQHVLNNKKELVFLKDIPDLDFNINSCYVSRPLTLPMATKLRKPCSLDFASYAKRTRQYDQVLDQLLANFPQVHIYNPRPLFCNARRCRVKDHKYPYYANGDHLNTYGATMVIKDLKQQLALRDDS